MAKYFLGAALVSLVLLVLIFLGQEVIVKKIGYEKTRTKMKKLVPLNRLLLLVMIFGLGGGAMSPFVNKTTRVKIVKVVKEKTNVNQEKQDTAKKASEAEDKTQQNKQQENNSAQNNANAANTNNNQNGSNNNGGNVSAGNQVTQVAAQPGNTTGGGTRTNTQTTTTTQPTRQVVKYSYQVPVVETYSTTRTVQVPADAAE